jgi:hypothetical protein
VKELGNNLQWCVDDCVSIKKQWEERGSKKRYEGISRKKLCLLFENWLLCWRIVSSGRIGVEESESWAGFKAKTNGI